MSNEAPITPDAPSPSAPIAPAPPPPPAFLRRLAEAFAGSAVGFILWSIFGPGLLGWWYEPPVKEVVSCANAVRVAVGQFVIAQMVSALVGAVVIALVLFFIRRWWDKRQAAKSAALRAAQ